MKKTTSFRGILAAILCIVTALSLAGCAGNAMLPDDSSLYKASVGDIVAVPSPNDPFSEPHDRQAAMEKMLPHYGEIETLVKSVSKPTAPDAKNVNKTSYGTVDWSTAAQGYITFAATGKDREFVIESPDGTKGIFSVAKGESAKVALVDGAGKYQYAIGHDADANKSAYYIDYRNSFTVSRIDSDLAPFLVSTPYGDYENAAKAVKKAADAWDESKSQLDNVKAVAKSIRPLDYDKSKRQGSMNIYVDPDSVIDRNGGVCNEMSKLLVAMLRSQGVPAYYQAGTVVNGDGSHAWVRAWVEMSTETKDGTTCSNGAWVLLEATSGTVKTKTAADDEYVIPENLDYAN